MFKKIAAAAVLAGAVAFAAAGPTVLSAGSTTDYTTNVSTGVGNPPEPSGNPQAVGNWPDPM